MIEIETKIKERYAQLSELFFGYRKEFPFKFFVRDDGGGCHVEYDATGKLSLVGTDRGNETCRDETYDLNELMYWIFRKLAFSAAQAYEFKHRHPTDDSRRIWFPKAIQEISKISDDWGVRMKNEQDELLLKHPFNDDPFGLLSPDWTASMPNKYTVRYEEADSIFDYDLELAGDGVTFYRNSVRVSAGNKAPEPIHAVRVEEWLKKKFAEK